MNPEKLKKTTAQFYRNVRIGDVDGFVSLFAANGVSHDPVGTPPHVGPSGLRKFLEGILGLCDRLDIAAAESVFFADKAAVTWTAFAVGKNGSRTEFGGIDVFTFDAEGKILTLHAFWDAGPLMKALTASGQANELTPVP